MSQVATPVYQCLPVLPSVLWEDRLDHMTLLESAGVCDQPTPWAISGGLCVAASLHRVTECL